MNIVSALSKALQADDSRRSRFHTSAGELVVSADIIRALSSTLGRHLFNRYSNLPWLTYPAISFIDDRLRGRRLFEFGSGTSTKWFGERCTEVHSVENNASWFRQVESEVGSMPNVHVKFAATDAEMVASVAATGGQFGAIVVDCQPADEAGEYRGSDDFRIACLQAAIPFAAEDCLFIIDNTDAMPRLSGKVVELFPNRQVHRFSGWAPGIFHPNETTVII
jgi:hypothetical protein